MVESQEDEFLFYSGLVFGSPTGFMPAFHWPRFFNKATRSPRLSTLRLAAVAPPERRLRCKDIGFV